MNKSIIKEYIILFLNSLIMIKRKEKVSTPKNLKEALKGKLTKEEFMFAPKSFDSFGDIAVIEIPKELEKKKKLIGSTLLKMQPRFDTILSIESNHEGEFRIQKVKVIAGKRNKVATYKESGVTLKVPLGEVFFSPRLGTERLRIAKEIKEGEIIGCFFSGVGPYPIVFSKNSKMKSAVAIELNPVAHEYAVENSVINKCSDKIVFFKGDVKEVYKNFKNNFDRIAMPLPHTGYQFLEEAFYCIKEKGIIYFYEIVEKGNFKLPQSQIRDAAKKMNRKIRIINKRRVRQFSPSKEQIVFDIKVIK
jgi:tRNA (guanine37-N1)-methyltransferase